jgi:MATE family multidrug resistance protein
VGIIDIALVGRLGSPAYMGGVGFGTMVFILVYTGLAFLRMGTTGLTAQAYGASDFRESASVLLRALSFSVLAGLILIALQVPMGKLLITKLDGSKEALGYALEYFNTRIYAAPATLVVFVFIGWFIGMQNAKIPMIITFIISISNAILSSVFVLVFDMEIKGVALGTVISQYIGLIFCLLFYYRKFKRITYFFKIKSVLNFAAVKRFMTVSRDIFIRSLLLTGSFFLFNAVSASLGNNVLAINSVMLQFLWFFAHVIDGFSYAGGTLAGRYKGAKNQLLLNKSVKKSYSFALYISIGFTVFYMLLTKPLFSILTDNVEVINMSQNFAPWVWILPLASFTAFIYDGIYIGVTATTTLRNVMLVIIVCVFIPSLFILKYYGANHGMWLALIFMLIGRGVGLRIFLKKSLEI